MAENKTSKVSSRLSGKELQELLAAAWGEESTGAFLDWKKAESRRFEKVAGFIAAEGHEDFKKIELKF